MMFYVFSKKVLKNRNQTWCSLKIGFVLKNSALCFSKKKKKMVIKHMLPLLLVFDKKKNKQFLKTRIKLDVIRNLVLFLKFSALCFS